MKFKTMKIKRRTYGEYITPVQIFKKYILPEIKDDLYKYIWVDLFAGEGNLILPILEMIPKNNRIEFFKKHIFLFDVQESLVNKAIDNAVKYGIPQKIAQENIRQRDTIKDYPSFLLDFELPIFHITNPPYLYIGYIVKHPETQKYIDYFQGENKGFQDLYQLALVNDLRYSIKKMVYIIPSNFLFGLSVSNKIRNVVLPFYTIRKAIIFERGIFEFTGTNVIICFFERKNIPKNEIISFNGIKINIIAQKRKYILDPENQYRAGSEFEKFVNEYKAIKPLNITYYLTLEEVEKNKGEFEIEVLNVNAFNKTKYEKMKIYVNEKLFNKIKSNILFIRTLDSGTINGRAGLYEIKNVFDTDGILVTKSKYRTQPIQIFIQPSLTIEEQILLKDYFNLLLEYFREKTDSEFMTTYKYSNSKYTRKYLGLSQVKNLVKTFPYFSLNDNDKIYLRNLIINKNIKKIMKYISDKNKN
ncbi:MAG: N-6 DNA methylase [Thermoplasmata archaeon]